MLFVKMMGAYLIVMTNNPLKIRNKTNRKNP